MIEYQDTLEFNADKPILVMDKLYKSYQLGSTELRVLREIDLTIDPQNSVEGSSSVWPSPGPWETIP